MLVKVLRKSHDDDNSVDLSRFEVGHVYEVGTILANYLLASNLAEPSPPGGVERRQSPPAGLWVGVERRQTAR